MIVGFCGVAGAGKDTAAAYLIKHYGFERKAIADPIKKSAAALLNIDYEDIDRLKNDPDARVYLGADPLIQDMSFREFLINYGDKSHRGVFGENFWIDVSLPVEGFYLGRNIVVTDVRLENEVNRIRELPGIGIIIRIDRPGLDNKILHRSEQPELLKTDYVITNNGSIEQLHNSVEKVLQDHLLGVHYERSRA